MKLLIAEPEDFSREVLSELRKKFDLKIIDNLSKNQFEKAFQEYDIIWFRLNYNVLNIDHIEKVKCKYLICPVTGVNHISEKFVKKNGIELISLKGENQFLQQITPTAEHTIFLTLSLMRNTFNAIDDVKNGNWNRDRFRGHELKNKKVGIIGYGRLGAMTASIFSSFQCEVLVYDLNIKVDVQKKHQQTQNIEDIFKHCDIISIHVDLNSSTEKFINASLLKYCKNTFLINTSRGEVLNEKDIINALEEGKLKGVAADVVNKEATDFKESLLFQKNMTGKLNIILTPHIGGNTYESFHKTEAFVLKKLINHIKTHG